MRTSTKSSQRRQTTLTCGEFRRTRPFEKNFLQPNFLQISLFVFFLYENSTYQESTVINDMAFFKAIEKVYPKKKVYTEKNLLKLFFIDVSRPFLIRSIQFISYFIVLKKIS